MSDEGRALALAYLAKHQARDLPYQLTSAIQALLDAARLVIGELADRCDEHIDYCEAAAAHRRIGTILIPLVETGKKKS